MDISIFSKDEIFNNDERSFLASGKSFKFDTLQASKFVFGTELNISNRPIVEFNPSKNQFITDDGSIHEYQVLILADDLQSDFSYTPGLERQLMNFKSQVNSIDCVDMCFKQSKFSETSRLSNRTV